MMEDGFGNRLWTMLFTLTSALHTVEEALAERRRIPEADPGDLKPFREACRECGQYYHRALQEARIVVESLQAVLAEDDAERKLSLSYINADRR